MKISRTLLAAGSLPEHRNPFSSRQWARPSVLSQRRVNLDSYAFWATVVSVLSPHFRRDHSPSVKPSGPSDEHRRPRPPNIRYIGAECSRCLCYVSFSNVIFRNLVRPTCYSSQDVKQLNLRPMSKDQRVGHLDNRLKSKGCFSCIRMKVKVGKNHAHQVDTPEMCLTYYYSAIRQDRTASGVPTPAASALATARRAQPLL
jgi:hypothetical protein